MFYRIMVSSIQVSEELKGLLAGRKRAGQSYEDVILELVVSFDKERGEFKELMKEGCLEMAEDSLRICKEMEGADYDLDWEWKD